MALELSASMKLRHLVVIMHIFVNLWANMWAIYIFHSVFTYLSSKIAVILYLNTNGYYMWTQMVYYMWTQMDIICEHKWILYVTTNGYYMWTQMGGGILNLVCLCTIIITMRYFSFSCCMQELNILILLFLYYIYISDSFHWFVLLCMFI